MKEEINQNFVSTFKEVWNNKKGRILVFFTLILLSITLYSFLHFLAFNESRVGYLFNDPILNLFQPINVSVLTFIVTYGFVLLGIVIAFRNPFSAIKLAQVYVVITLLRMLCLYLLPLEAPPKIIPLEDPFLFNTFYSNRENVKDLFFSGHTATMFMFAFLSKNRKVKLLFICAGVLVGLLVLIQHVHYSIDVLAAPFLAYLSFKLQNILSAKFNSINKIL